MDDDAAYPLHQIVKSIMFSYGDVEEPLRYCQEFLLQLVQNQLQMLLRRAVELGITRRSMTIGFCEVLFSFRRHPLFIKRLVQYLKMRELMPALMHKVNSQDSEFDLDVDLNEEKNARLKSMFDALRLLDVFNEFEELLDPTLGGGAYASTVDEIKMERLRRMTLRVQGMDAATYERFSAARTVSFCSKKGKKSVSYAQSFLRWLNAPPMEPGIVYVLNYCATELVAIMVDHATLVREQEAKHAFRDDHPREALQLRHYQEALRRNTGFAKRGDILFGNF